MGRISTALVATALFVTLLAVVPAPAHAETVNWSDTHPVATKDTVVIPVGQTVVLDTDVDIKGLRIMGTVECGDTSVNLKARWIIVAGTFRCGTKSEPFTKNLRITLKGNGNGSYNGFGDKYIVVMNGGKLALHGKDRTSWVRLSKTARAGDTELHIDQKAWKAGDRLVVTPTNYYIHQTEEVRVVSRTGKVITLDAPLEREHYCSTDSYAGKSIAECAEVGLLSHNIVIKGNESSSETRIGGHTMFHPGSTVHIEGVTLRRMGQYARLARYPVHWHHADDASGSYIRDSAIDEAYNRFVTLHDTHNVAVKRVVGHNTIGHGFYLEDGIETGNKLNKNLAVLVKGASSGDAVTPSDTQASGFWISNPDNTVDGNVAAAVDFAGFWLGFPEHPLGTSTTDDIWPRRTPLKSFESNTAHTVGFAGLYLDGGEDSNRNTGTTWFEPRQDPSDPDSAHVRPTIGGFTTYKSNHYGMWMRTFSGVKVVDAKLADNWRSVYLANITSGPSRDNVGLITDSLLVGTSSNKGHRENWEIADVDGHTVPMHWEPNAEIGGVPFYDGPMKVKDTVFANFKRNDTRNSGALTGLIPNVFSISVLNSAENLTFVNSRKVLFPNPAKGRQGDLGIVFTDVDGSVTGTAGARVVADPTLLDDASCSAMANWRAAVCDGRYARISIRRLDGKDIEADITRTEDERTVYWRGSSEGDSAMSVNLQVNTRHDVDFRQGRATGYTFWTAEILDGGSVRIAVPAPPGSWNVTIWGLGDPEVDSLDALKSVSAGFYYQASKNLIHLKFSEDHRGGEIK